MPVDNDADYDAYFKCLLVGDSGVGKTQLLNRLLHDKFNETTTSTIGVDLGTVTLDISGKIVKAQIWDTAGQERYRAVTPSYYKGAHGVLLVYDVTSSTSFQAMNKWLAELRSYAPKATVIMCGNKNDMAHLRAVSVEQGQALCQAEGLFFMETSAKTSENVHAAFTTLLSELYHSSVRSMTAMLGDEAGSTLNPEQTTAIKIQPDAPPPKKGGCCSQA